MTKKILVQAHELAIAHSISAEEAIAMLDELDGEDIWLIYHDCQEAHIHSTKNKDEWIKDTFNDGEKRHCPECEYLSYIEDYTFEKAKLFPCEDSSYSQYFKNRDRVPTEILRESDNILCEWIVPKDYPRKENDDVAEAYLLVEREKASQGVIIFAKYRNQWMPNPPNTKPFIKYLFQVGFNRLEDQGDTEDAIASQENKKQWDEDVIQSLLVQSGVDPVTVEACVQKDGTRLWGIFQSCNVMSKEDGLWYYNQRSSSRPDNYQELFRWDSAQEAFDFAVKMLKRNDAIANHQKIGD